MACANRSTVLGSVFSSIYASKVVDLFSGQGLPAQAIVAATRNSAEFLRLTDAGTLEVGKSADFIVLDANPLDDITNTRRIASVYLRGAMVDRAPFRVTPSGQTTQ